MNRSSIPLELPIRAGEAATLADVIFQVAANRPLRDEVRRRIAARLAVQDFQTLRALPGSLAQDPVHAAAYFIAIDAIGGPETAPLLLRIALASTPANALFPNATLIARTRSGHDEEYVINSVPFAPANPEPVRLFASEIDSGFMPRPSGLQPVISIATSTPEVDLPAAFLAYRQVLKRHGPNVASVLCAGGDPEYFLAVAMWSAIRAGWREGYSAVLRVSLDEGMGAARERIRRGSEYTKFLLTTESSELKPETLAELNAFITRLKSGRQPWKHFDLATIQAGKLKPPDARPSLEVSDPGRIVALADSLRG